MRHLPRRSPRVRQSIALFLCICRILGVPASQVSPFSCVMVLTQPLWLAGLGRWVSNNLPLCCLLTLPIPPSHFVFVPGRNREFDICPGPCPSFLKLFASSLRDKGELTLCESVLPLGLVFVFRLRRGVKWQQAQSLILYLSHFCCICL